MGNDIYLISGTNVSYKSYYSGHWDQAPSFRIKAFATLDDLKQFLLWTSKLHDIRLLASSAVWLLMFKRANSLFPLVFRYQATIPKDLCDSLQMARVTRSMVVLSFFDRFGFCWCDHNFLLSPRKTRGARPCKLRRIVCQGVYWLIK